MVTTDRLLRTTVRAKISSIAAYVPPRVLTNGDLERMVDTSDEWIMQRVGIRERHIVDPGVATSDLAKEASLLAIEKAGLKPDDIDFILVATTTPDTMFPSTACVLQAKIGANHAWGYDLVAACSGFTYALTTASQLVASGAHEHALVVGADVMSSIIDYQDRATCVIFGDGAGAVVVSAAPPGGPQILDFEHEIDGGEVGRRDARIDDVALADAGALQDPFVAGLDHLLEIGVGQDFRRDIGGEAGNLHGPERLRYHRRSFAGAVNPKYSYARAVATRPRGVRSRKPA